LTIDYQLPIANYQLPIANCQLPIEERVYSNWQLIIVNSAASAPLQDPSGKLVRRTMPEFTCPHCQKPFTAPPTAGLVHCPLCQQSIDVPTTPASRWYLARDNKKLGPYTWQQLCTLAEDDQLHADDMLLQEGERQWVRADTLNGLFADRAPDHSTSPFLLALIGLGLCAIVAVSAAIGFLVLPRNKTIEPPPVAKSEDLRKDLDTPKPKDLDTPEPQDNDPKKNGKIEPKTKPPDEKQPKSPSREEVTARFVARLNRYRKSAGLDAVTVDAELSQGCQAHAQYLAKQVDPPNLADEDPKKPGYSVEGKRAAQNALIVQADPLDALEQWMGSLFQRAALLSPGTRGVGIGFEPTKDGWICVVDPLRGSGEPIVIVPAPNQLEVPLSFTSGPEVPDEKAAAGYPLSITFPPAQRITGASIELRDAKGKAIDGWTWTPQKPLSNGRQRNSIAFVPKGLLQGRTVYQVKASATVDGKPWSLDWKFTTADDVDTDGVWARKALAKVNEYRAAAGLKPVALDEKLSGPCLAHARYLVINEGDPALQGLSAHDEDLKLPGASKEGAIAGKASVIAVGDYEPIDGVDSWMGTLYHRVPMLEPNLKTIGFGCVRGRRQGWAVVLNVSSGVERMSPSQPVFYPAPDQTDVPIHFPNGGEEPNPIPESKTGRAGYPITASFPRDTPLKSVRGNLTDAKGTEIACWLSSPEKPANPRFAGQQGNSACLIAKAPLSPNTKFHVHFEGQVAGKAWEKKWNFTTGAAGPSVAAAGRQVLDRLNLHRADVGLSPVILDDTLSRGCQLHAEYLAINADVLLQKNVPVNDEDPNIPGFTHDGLQSARQSLVFTNAPHPVLQIDDLMASFTGRVFILDPLLKRVGIGCAHDIGRGWRCVLNASVGRGETREIVYPAAKQDDVPLLGYDRLGDGKTQPGFPITVTFPRPAKVGKVAAELKDANGKQVEIHISSPTMPLDVNRQAGIVGVHPLAPLQPDHLYTVTISAIVNGREWRQTWQFTTKR
jgi:uncharacterized protein YkwD